MFHYPVLAVGVLSCLINVESLNCPSPDGSLICPEDKQCCPVEGGYECCDRERRDTLSQTSDRCCPEGSTLKQCCGTTCCTAWSQCCGGNCCMAASQCCGDQCCGAASKCCGNRCC